MSAETQPSTGGYAVNTDDLRISTRADADGKISNMDMIDEIDAGAQRIHTLMASLWALGQEGSIDGEHLGHLTDLARQEADRIKKFVNAWFDQQKDS